MIFKLKYHWWAVSGSGAVSRHSKKMLERERSVERETAERERSGARAGVTKTGLSAERQIGCSRSNHCSASLTSHPSKKFIRSQLFELSDPADRHDTAGKRNNMSSSCALCIHIGQQLDDASRSGPSQCLQLLPLWTELSRLVGMFCAMFYWGVLFLVFRQPGSCHCSLRWPMTQ